MATLVSPGVDVSIINEAFYGSPGAGTIPLVVVATANNKLSPSGGLAPQTATTADPLYLATSQRDLVQNFGNPNFLSSGGTPLHGHELNEYGLHAAYSYLGVSNRAYVLRADIDLAQLESSVSSPVGPAVTGTYWLDLSSTKFGVFQSNGNATAGLAWDPINVLLPTASQVDPTTHVPLSSYGANGNFAVVTETTSNFVYEKDAGAWTRVGTSAWKAAHPTVVTGSLGTYPVASLSTLIINSQTVTLTSGAATVSDVITAINAVTGIGVVASPNNGKLVLTDNTGGNIVIGSGTANAAVGLVAGTYKGVSLTMTNNAQYPAGSVAGDIWVKLSAPNSGAAWSLKRYDGAQWAAVSAPFYAFNSTLTDGDVTKDAAALAALPNTAGVVYVGFDAVTGAMQPRRYSGTAYAPLVYEALLVAPTTSPVDGTYWYNADMQADIMVGNGTHWQGYQNRFGSTDPIGVIIAGSAPTTQSDGTVLVDNDLWIDSSDTENYPALYRYNGSTGRWRLVDKTDQTTPFGIVFADARADSGPAFTGMPNSGAYTYNSTVASDLLLSDYLDPDAPDPRLYPDGTILFNTRASTNNVKVWRPVYFLDGNFDPNTNFTVSTYSVGGTEYVFPALASPARWVNTSGNKTDGSPYMGRKAQRAIIVRAMAEAIASNEDIRSEPIFFNLIAAPGYPELIDELVTLNTDQKEVAFIVGDTPARLLPNGLAIQNWATNALDASSNGEDGLTTASEYVGIYYPWGMSTNVDGTDVMVPPSTVALRTIAYNDQVSYPWFAPAGFQRGLVSNATSVGYLTSEGEFKSVVLNQGQRDVLYTNKINPIAYMNGAGLVVYGQKTLDSLSSAMDRINVARLVNYARSSLDNLTKPFLFQPNDAQTRDGARLAVERFLAGLVGLRALEDFAVLCDETNNTPERRDRNELWIDIAIIPTKAVEFIYIPVRLRDSGSSLDF